jgi:DNA repair exonuclease SbcCD ATPase subunit
MIFLIGKIFVYLVLAGAIGGAAGWLLRNLQAQRTEENALRSVTDAKSKLPQLESLLRGRDEQIQKLKAEIADRKTQTGELEQQIRSGEQSLREQQRLAERLQHTVDARKSKEMSDFDLAGETEVEAVPDSTDTDKLIAELSAEISRLKEQLAQPAPVSVQDSGEEAVLQIELEDLREKLTSAQGKLHTTHADLMQEQNKVSELERERELQNKSLQVLHQQLELERTRRTANG